MTVRFHVSRNGVTEVSIDNGLSTIPAQGHLALFVKHRFRYK